MATVTSSKRQLTHTSNTYESNGDVTIGGNLNINGTTTTIDTTNLLVEDKNIIIGDVSSPSDTTADGGGITLKGASDKTINWVNSTDSWTSNQTFSAPRLTLTGLSNQSSEATALVVNGSNTVGTRELGSNAFNSTSFLTGNQTITLSGDVSGSGTTSISVTVADDSHNHVISNVDGLQSALNAKAALASPALTGAVTVTGSGSSGNAFEVKRGSDSAQVLRVQNTGEVVVQNNYLYAASSGTSLYVQNSAVFRGSISNDASGQPVNIGDSLNVSGSLTISGTVDGRDVASDGTKLDGIASNANNYSLPAGSSSTRGGFKIGYSESGKNYPVEVSSEKMYVNVPWSDSNTTYSVGDGGLTQKNFTSTLKTKLDGIETGATADQTASEILTLIKTVDGSGSGLDADLIDGKSTADLYRREGQVDGAIASAGWVTVASNTSSRRHGEVIVSDSDSGDHAFIRIDWMRSYADSNFSVLQVGGHSNRITGVRVLYQTSDDTYGTKLLQVYVSTASTYGVRINTLGSPRGFTSHTVVTPVIENTKSGYALHGSALEDLDQVTLAAEEGIKTGGVVYASGGNSSNWNTAYGWGNHASAGYVTSSGNTVIGTDSDINTSGAGVIDYINMTDGVIQSFSTRTLTLANLGYTGATNANNYSLPAGSSSTRGGFKIGYSENGKNYPVEVSSEKMYVNVPWTDNNTTYSVGDGGLTQKNFTTTLKSKLDGIASGATANTGTLTSVGLSVGTGLDGGGTVSGSSGSFNTITLDLSELTDMTGAINTSQDELILLDNGAERRKLFSEIFGSNAYNSTTIPTNNNQLTNGAGYVTTDTNTTYTAGRGLDLVSSTQFELQTDLRDSISYIGYDSNDYLHWSNNSYVRAVVNGAERFRVNTEGIDVTGLCTVNAYRTDNSNSEYNLLTRNSTSSTLYVQAAGSASTQPIASFRYGSTSAGQGTEVLAVRRNSSYFNNTKLGVGLTNPGSDLSVSGGVAIGASYATSSAPSNGMLIQGNVGIGTSSVSGYYALQVNGSIQGSYKSFVIDHPTKENTQLAHACLEGPEIGVYFRGKSTSDTIVVADYWDSLVDIDSMSVELTAIGQGQDLFVSSIKENGDVVVGTNTDEPLNYYYVVYGERKDINKLVVEFEIEENDDEEESIAESPNVVDTDSVEYINP